MMHKKGYCENPDCKRKGEEVYIYAKGLCKWCYDYEKAKEQAEKQREKPVKKYRIPARGKSERQSLIHSLDSMFSKLRRLEGANEKGIVKCITCPATAPWDNIGLGHFVPRWHMGLRWYPENGHAQCSRCNVQLEGNVKVYEEEIVKRYGEEKLSEMLDIKNSNVKYTKLELQQMLNKFENKLKELKNG